MSGKSTTTDTNTTNQYNAAGMANYNQFQGVLGKNLNDYASSPLSSAYFNQQAGMANANASAVGQRNISNVTNNLRTGGGLLGNSGAFLQSQVNRAGLGTSALQSAGFNGALNTALANRQWATSSMQGYTPLQTGQSSNQTTTTNGGTMGLISKLGGAALTIGGAAMTGGLSLAAKPLIGAALKGFGGALSSNKDSEDGSN